MKIGELSRLTGIPVETIRFYEKERLLPAPARTESNYRVYTEDHLRKLKLIKHCRSMDLSLDEIRNLLEILDSPSNHAIQAHEIINEHIRAIDRKVEELQKIRLMLQDLANKCHVEHHHDAEECELIASLRKPISD